MSAELKLRITNKDITELVHKKAERLADHSDKTASAVEAVFPGSEFVSASEIEKWLNEGWSFTFIAEGGNFIRDNNKRLKFFHSYWDNCHEMDLVVVTDHYKGINGKNKIWKHLELHKPENPKDEFTWQLANRLSKNHKPSDLEKEIPDII